MPTPKTSADAHGGLLEKPDGEKVAFEVPPMQFDTAGFDVNAPVLEMDFKAIPKTHSEQVFDEIKKNAYGVQSMEETDKLWKAGVPTRDAFAGRGTKGRRAADETPLLRLDDAPGSPERLARRQHRRMRGMAADPVSRHRTGKRD
ncbi:hypothetical protein [uncultured Bilophila sp.]|uniref:hypothetical protein n=1 Tax=uncultured Bilophila sp. TaxID=529385 RepID=UPI00280A9FB1|nr:hypothetical protein [uncultured Bilophila sp.]